MGGWGLGLGLSYPDPYTQPLLRIANFMFSIFYIQNRVLRGESGGNIGLGFRIS